MKVWEAEVQHSLVLINFPMNSTKRKSLFESKSLSLVLLRIWFTLGARVRLFSTKNCQGIGGLSRVKVSGVNGLKIFQEHLTQQMMCIE